ncbi:MAG TPA: site-2 protease family protein [Verrucomicrobiae bacterium]|nr:site-2 protease family protein [Verrucomicrobiae bacterium]
MAIDERLTEEVSPAVPARPMAGTRSPTVHVVLLAATVLSATLAGVDVEPRALAANPALLLRGLPYAATLVTILLVHELGHYLTCLRYRVSASLPYFLPAPLLSPVGTFGAFIRIRSRFPDRRALFDIGASGPWAGFVVALAATVIGLAHSTVLATPQEWHGFVCGDSLLTAFLTRIVLHVDSAVVVLHPVAFAGWFGLFVTSLNLLPVGQLDGGHVLYATLGRPTPRIAALLIAFLVWLGVRGFPGWLLWAAIITVLLSLGHPPTDDDRRPLDPGRRLAALATLVVFVLTFVPEPFKILP